MEEMLHRIIKKVILPNFDIEKYDINVYPDSFGDVVYLVDFPHKTLRENKKNLSELVKEMRMIFSMFGLTQFEYGMDSDTDNLRFYGVENKKS